ncbi:MAG TPA: hypothetical protein HA349_05005, partial [Methanotrichaceae archaeon]|nr:hypothetical protein [Methanotrichaceae archaeon]
MHGLESMILIGDSSGSSIAVDYALRAPYRIKYQILGAPLVNPYCNLKGYHGPGDSNLGEILLDVNSPIPPAFIIAKNGSLLLFARNPVEADAISRKMAGLDPLKIE